MGVALLECDRVHIGVPEIRRLGSEVEYSVPYSLGRGGRPLVTTRELSATVEPHCLPDPGRL